MKRILITGATGQIGSELTIAMRRKYGESNVVAAVHRRQPDADLLESGPYCSINVRDADALQQAVQKYRIDTIFHLASVLSAAAEHNPQLAWEVNMGGLHKVLETARQFHCAVFFPSSIGAFGPGTPLENTPQVTIQRPNTIYGITKLAGELLCDYYHHHFGVDIRGLRLPGLISYKTMPGGGTTDYAVEIFCAAVTQGRYRCFLRSDTRLDMMYMPDAIRAIMILMEADDENLIHRNAYNVTAMNFTPEELAAQIRKSIPDFSIEYEIDPVRQAIADSWPRYMDDTAARTEWGWLPHYDIAAMTQDMLDHMAIKLAKPNESDYVTG
ncbi:MAG: NAD-dependent epimerase/dehydratase family protein [Syntrophobacter sp.]